MSHADRKWKKPGDFGTWVDEDGGRHWLYPDDRPFVREDGTTVILRVAIPSTLSIFGPNHTRLVLVGSLTERGPFRSLGYIDLDSEGWHARVQNPENKHGTIVAGRFGQDRDAAIRFLVNRNEEEV